MHRIYLSGPIAGHSIEYTKEWRELVTDEFADCDDIEILDPMRDKYAEPNTIIFNPNSVSALDEVLLTDRGVVTRDHFDTVNSDLLIVNYLCSLDKSLGTMSEIAWAWDRQIPIVTVIENTGNPNDHPFVRAMTSYRVDKLDRAINVARSILGRAW